MEYNQIHYQIKLEKILGKYYLKKGQLLLANNHLLKAIGYCIQHSINPASLYEKVGEELYFNGTVPRSYFSF